MYRYAAICMRIHTQNETCKFTHIHTSNHTRIHIHIHTCICAYVHTWINTHLYKGDAVNLSFFHRELICFILTAVWIFGRNCPCHELVHFLFWFCIRMFHCTVKINPYQFIYLVYPNDDVIEWIALLTQVGRSIPL